MRIPSPMLSMTPSFGPRSTAGPRAAGRSIIRGRAAVHAKIAIILAAVLAPLTAAAEPDRRIGLPPIRTNADNVVPACVTPESLEAFTRARNPTPASKFEGLARHYREFGDALRIRWDYAYFQMLLETNYLKFRRGDGSPGDVSASQNNFAGLGATGNGVPGDRFPDVRRGVLGHLQHLVAYSGETVVDPVAPRTREKQNDIVFLSRKLGRAPTFADLSRRWAVDPRYGRNIESIAELYRADHCTDTQSAGRSANEPPHSSTMPQTGSLGPVGPSTRNPAPGSPTQRSENPATAAGTTFAPQAPCDLFTASFGGELVRVISSREGTPRRVTLLTVSRAQADAQTKAFMATHAPGGEIVGTFESLDAAMLAGEKLCPAS